MNNVTTTNNQNLVYTLNTSNISTGINLGNLLSPAGYFSFEENDNQNYKKYEVIESKEDLLALSCAWFRLRNDPSNNIFSIGNLLSSKLYECVNEDDRLKANQVRDYYSKKFMVMTLKDMKLTNFRKELCEYLNGEGTKFVESTLPMIYRLPEFYEHDIEFDKVKSTFKLDIPNAHKINGQVNITLECIATFTKSNRQGKFKEYWLKDSNNYAYRFAIQHFNSLLGLWEKEFKKKTLDLSVYVAPKKQDELDYLQIISIS